MISLRWEVDNFAAGYALVALTESLVTSMIIEFYKIAEAGFAHAARHGMSLCSLFM